jgi:aldehyde dehydrogenase (NAD+)
MDIVKEDISGLVAVVIKFENEEEALKQANDTQYGLVAAVFTKDITHGIQFSQKLRAGTIWINSVDCVYPNVPFRGYKQSGIGRECGQYALDTCLLSDLLSM